MVSIYPMAAMFAMLQLLHLVVHAIPLPTASNPVAIFQSA
jgi:hypothetical protein